MTSIKQLQRVALEHPLARAPHPFLGTEARHFLDLHGALAGVGDPERERGCRMNVTLCLHRALSDSEIAAGRGSRSTRRRWRRRLL